MFITEKKLLKHQACADQLAIFVKEWPKGMKVSKKSLLRAAELELDLIWFRGNFIPHSLTEELHYLGII